MKILVVSSYLPYPLFSGGHIRLYNLLKELAKKHEITLVCEKRDYQGEKEIAELEKICKKVIAVRRKKQWGVNNILKAGFSFSPFLVVGHNNQQMKNSLQNLLDQEKFDLIHVETFYVFQNLPKTNIPIILAEHNIEYLVYKRFADQQPVFIRPPFYIDVLKLKRVEENFWKKATKLISVSEEEKKLMKRKDVVVVHNGVDLAKFKFQISNFKFQNKERKILFIGDFKWIQNIDAAEWILKEIWSKLKLKVESGKLKVDLKLWIVGKNIPDSIKKLGGDDIIFDEDNKKETQEIFHEADILIAPIRIGGGTSFKILEAMASGVPVVTTKLGIEGINAKEQEEVLIGGTANEIAEKTAEILTNESLYKKVAANARKLIEEKYEWKKIVQKLEEVYASAIK